VLLQLSLHSYIPTLNLHSFPTRRSSDLDVHQLEALAVFLEQLHRVLAWMDNPEDVHFVADKVGLGFSHQQVKEGALAVRLKLIRSEEHTSELQSLRHLVCRLLLEKKKTK